MSPAGRAPLVTVVGLGPAGPAHLGDAARNALAGADVAFLRTARHPAASEFGGIASFDHHYDAADTFEEVYARIVEDLVAAALRVAPAGRVVYAVPGSPLVAESTVELLRRDPRVEVEVVPALSFLDLAWAALGIDPVASGVQLVDGARIEAESAGGDGPFLVAQCWSADVLSRVKLALDCSDDAVAPRAVVLSHLGLPDQSVTEVAWEDLDRVVEPDHLTTLWVERLSSPVSGEMAKLAELVRTLREKCPWDREQTHASLTRHLIEETYEVLDAIGEVTASAGAPGSAALDDAAAHLQEELGDLLFQVVFHSRLAAEQGWFTLGDVALGVHDKLVGRHPHVFGDVAAATPDAVVANWEVIKAAEKGRSSVTDGIPTALPALLLAAKLRRKAGAVEMATPSIEEQRRHLEATVSGLTPEAAPAAFGTALYALVGLADALGVDAEDALRSVALSERDRIVAAERDGSSFPDPKGPTS